MKISKKRYKNSARHVIMSIASSNIIYLEQLNERLIMMGTANLNFVFNVQFIVRRKLSRTFLLQQLPWNDICFCRAKLRPAGVSGCRKNIHSRSRSFCDPSICAKGKHANNFIPPCNYFRRMPLRFCSAGFRSLPIPDHTLHRCCILSRFGKDGIDNHRNCFPYVPRYIRIEPQKDTSAQKCCNKLSISSTKNLFSRFIFQIHMIYLYGVCVERFTCQNV